MMADTNTERHNTEQTKQYDSEEFEGLFALLRPKLLIFFELRGVGNEAEDLADEVIIRFVSRIVNRSDVSDPVGYCFGLAKNVFREFLREKKRDTASLGARFDSYTSHTPHLATADASADKLMDCLETALDELAPEDRHLILSYYAGDFEKRRGIARELGITTNVLRVRLHRIRARLRAVIDAEGR